MESSDPFEQHITLRSRITAEGRIFFSKKNKRGGSFLRDLRVLKLTLVLYNMESLKHWSERIEAFLDKKLIFLVKIFKSI